MSKTTPLYSRVGIVFNPEKDRARAEGQKLKRWFVQKHIEVTLGARVSGAMRKAELVVALGGDGTVLRVAREVAAWGIPVLGVNVGRLGFLAATEVGAMYRTLAHVLAGRGRTETRTMLSASGLIHGKGFGPFIALNDCVLRSGATGRVLQLQATVRGRLLASYTADGLIVATPTGSTAYNLAASGPIVYPDLDVLVLSPICPHTLAQRPLVLPPFEILAVEIIRPSPSALFCMDGQITRTLGPGDRVEIRRAAEQIQLLMDPERTYYQVLQSKLKWGGS
jgi:NAD+ kinase